MSQPVKSTLERMENYSMAQQWADRLRQLLDMREGIQGIDHARQAETMDITGSDVYREPIDVVMQVNAMRRTLDRLTHRPGITTAMVLQWYVARVEGWATAHNTGTRRGRATTRAELKQIKQTWGDACKRYRFQCHVHEGYEECKEVATYKSHVEAVDAALVELLGEGGEVRY